MLDPDQTVHIDPATVKWLWAAIAAFSSTTVVVLGFAATMIVKARAWFLRSDRAAKTDDLVHGKDRIYVPREQSQADHGLGARVDQLEEDQTEQRARLVRVERAFKLDISPEEQARQDRERFLNEAHDTGAYRALRAEHHARPDPPAPRKLPYPSTHRGRDDE